MEITKVDKGKVQTVLGPIKANDMGIVLPHEHLFDDLRNWFIEPSAPDDKEKARQPVSLQDLSWLRSHTASSLDNLQLGDEETAISEAMRFGLLSHISISWFAETQHYIL